MADTNAGKKCQLLIAGEWLTVQDFDKEDYEAMRGLGEAGWVNVDIIINDKVLPAEIDSSKISAVIEEDDEIQKKEGKVRVKKEY